jgi:serine/threonine protein kinase
MGKNQNDSDKQNLPDGSSWAEAVLPENTIWSSVPSKISEELLSAENNGNTWSLVQISILDLIRSFHQGRKTATIYFTLENLPDQEKSILGFVDGHLICACHTKFTGRDALFELVKTKTGNFSIGVSPPSQRNIDIGTESLLKQVAEFLESGETAMGELSNRNQSMDFPRPRESRDVIEEEATLGALILGRYRLVRELGQGGMGAVRLGRDDLSGQEVAVKILPPDMADNDKAVARFDREARALAKLDHPNIVPLLTYAVEDKKRYIIMKYVSGSSLQDKIDSSRGLKFDFCAKVMRGVLSALDYAHQSDIIHRDIKPGNVLVDEHDRIFLADFGIARMSSDLRLTRPDMVVGSPQYMSPEQVTGKEISPATDLYATGLVLFEMLTGRPPFMATAEFSIMRMHLESQVPSPSRLRRELVEPKLLRLLAALLQKDPENRPRSARDALEIVAGPEATQTTDKESWRFFSGETELRENVDLMDEISDSQFTDDTEKGSANRAQNEFGPGEFSSTDILPQQDVQFLDITSVDRLAAQEPSGLDMESRKRRRLGWGALASLLICIVLLGYFMPGDSASKEVSTVAPKIADKNLLETKKVNRAPTNTRLTESKAAKAPDAAPKNEKPGVDLTVGEASNNGLEESGKVAEETIRQSKSKPVASNRRHSSKASRRGKSAAAGKSRDLTSKTKAQIRKVRQLAKEKGILTSDLSKWAQLSHNISKQAAAGQDAAASDTSAKAMKLIRETKIDRSFVDRKLLRFNKKYGQISSNSARKDVDQRLLHVIKAMNTGNYMKANRELNRCFAALR